MRLAPTHPLPAPAAPAVLSDLHRATRLLARLPLFEGVLTERDVEALEGAQVLDLPAGTPVFQAGTPAHTLYVVVLGRIRLTLGTDASMRDLGHMGRGDTIGLAALLRGDLYPVNAEVAEDAVLVALPAAALRRILAEQPRMGARLVGDMGAKLARFVREIGGFTQRSARARVARLLCDLYREAGVQAEVGFGEAKRLLASRLAMTPETLSRELHALAEAGLIESRRTRFRVLDFDRLNQAAQDAVAVAGTV